MTVSHHHFLTQCLQIAEKGRGAVGNGALVGAVLVRGEEVIAEGWHAQYGGDHAEAMLIKNCVQEIHPDDVLYVSLEPCNHTGKTPPCSQAIIAAGIQNVVIGTLDPHAEAHGGLEALRCAGIDVVGPVDDVRCRRFLRGFLSLQQQGRPWVTLKQARTKDGAFANPDGSPLKITNQRQDEWAHTHLRAAHDAILVGVQTVINDDPQLTVRFTESHHTPYRIILDPSLRIPLESIVLQDEHRSRTIVCTADKSSPKAQEIQTMGVMVLELRYEGDMFDLQHLFEQLTAPQGDFYGLSSILVEGGLKTWQMFKKAGCVNEEVVLVG